MSAAGCTVGKSFTTSATFVGLFSSVESLVACQSLLKWEGFFTETTLERLLSRVGTFMAQHVSFAVGWFATELTRESRGFGMINFMSFVLCEVCKLFATESTKCRGSNSFWLICIRNLRV